MINCNIKVVIYPLDDLEINNNKSIYLLYN